MRHTAPTLLAQVRAASGVCRCVHEACLPPMEAALSQSMPCVCWAALQALPVRLASARHATRLTCTAAACLSAACPAGRLRQVRQRLLSLLLRTRTAWEECPLTATLLSRRGRGTAPVDSALMRAPLRCHAARSARRHAALQRQRRELQEQHHGELRHGRPGGGHHQLRDGLTRGSIAARQQR
jgi:hypothetical protein